jgi:4-amino-4-deoxy-L-arabinose transferase-like glycosyltransferase
MLKKLFLINKPPDKNLVNKINSIYLTGFLILGIWLRFYKIFTNYYFSGELGKELLYIREFAPKSTLPLTGMQTSHTWLLYGPFYYWVMIPIFNVFHGNPFILFWIAWAVAIVSLFCNYYVVKKMIGLKVAVISTAVMALSPLLIWQTRLSKLHVFFYLLWNGKKKWLIPTGILFGILFSFHFSQIPLLVVLLSILYLKRHLYRVKDWVLFLFAILLPNITLLWHDWSLALWLPYRALNIEQKNFTGTLHSMNEFFGKIWFWDSRLWAIGTIIFFVVFVHYVYINRRGITKEFLPFYLSATTSVMLLANILHGTPPVHYFLPIFTTIPIFLAIYLSKIKYWYLILLTTFVINMIAFSSDSLFFGSVNNSKVDDFIPYSGQINVTNFIVKDTNGIPLSIKRVGPYDYFPENYSQNYKYLIVWQGGNLIDLGGVMYTITEDDGKVNVQK